MTYPVTDVRSVRIKEWASDGFTVQHFPDSTDLAFCYVSINSLACSEGPGTL